MTAADVFERLRQDSRTSNLPVILVTSQRLTPGELESAGDPPLLAKSTLTRDVLRSMIQDAVSAARTVETRS